MSGLNDASTCVSDLALDQLCAGELAAPQRDALELHLAQCARCCERQAAFARERAAFLAVAPSWQAQQALLARARPRNRRAPARAVWVGAALAACAVALSTLRPLHHTSTRHKGGPQLGFFVKRGELVERGSNGQHVRAGDRLRFSYWIDQPRYLALLDRDARSASVFFPAGDTAERVRAGADVALNFSIEIDAQPGPERVYAVFCPTPFAVAPLRSALALSGQLPALPDCQTAVIQLQKDLP